RMCILGGLAGVLCVFIGVLWMNVASAGLPRLHPKLGWLYDYLDVNSADPLVTHFYFLRFMLGFFEGGFFPSVILYLSLWFRPKDRGRAIATFMAAIPFSNLIGSPISAGVLQIDWFDLPGWRWIFILPGILPLFPGGGAPL